MQTSEVRPAQRRARQLIQFLLLSYVITLANTYGFLRNASFANLPTTLYTVAVYLSYSFIYLLPATAIIAIANFLLRPLDDDNRKRLLTTVRRDRIVFAIAILATGATQVLLFADRTIFTFFGMHLNGFVWNTIFTSGGMESAGGSSSATVIYSMLIFGYFIVQGLLALVVRRVPAFDRLWRRAMPRRNVIGGSALLVACSIGGTFGYGISDIRSYSPVLMSASVFPLYFPITFRHLARRMGFEVDARDTIRVSAADGRLNYPLKPIDLQPTPHPMNIVLLVAESLRADMLDPEIMPATWRFAERAHHFTRHYSGGNGTRMGMFSMFYGLYGNLWFTFLREHHGPVLIDVLQQLGYQMKMFTSARFTYPEFDRTVFAKLPGDQLHEEWGGLGWERDRRNVELILNFLRAQSPDRPFMTFMFFESPHARYYFPPESVIRTPYLEELNYATMDLDHDMPLIKNRYINACHHLDSQIARITDYLDQQNLLDSTIVLITGDHGEEFMEKGRWGHNSEFTEGQVRTPMVLWVPGTGASVSNQLTSHLDIAPTILPLLGVRNDPRDYSVGDSLLTGTAREYLVLADWSRIAYLDDKYKASFPIQMGGVLRNAITTPDDAPVEDTADFYRTRQSRLVDIMKDIGRFSR